MANLQITNARIQLNARERSIITRDLESMAANTFARQTKQLQADFKRRAQFRRLFDTMLAKVDFDAASLKKQNIAVMGTLDKKLTREAKKLGRAIRGGSRRQSRNTVWGLTSGVDVPTYDFQWTTHNIDGSPLDYATSADPGTGHIFAYAHCHDSRPKTVDSYAGVGFWYVPNRSGWLSIDIAPHLQQQMWTGAGWNDVGAAGGWITLGIASYLRSPFRFVRWETMKTDQLWWNVDHWFSFTTHNVDTEAYGMGVSVVADTEHYYACWAWVRAYAYAENGGSYGGSGVTADVGGFTYNLL
jgi:hypothetical protein